MVLEYGLQITSRYQRIETLNLSIPVRRETVVQNVSETVKPFLRAIAESSEARPENTWKGGVNQQGRSRS